MTVKEAECQVYENARLEGNTKVAGTFVGECVGLISSIRPAGDIIKDTITEATAILSRNHLLVIE